MEINAESTRCVDFHTHPVTDGFRKSMTELGIDPIIEDGFPLPAWNAGQHLAFMGLCCREKEISQNEVYETGQFGSERVPHLHGVHGLWRFHKRTAQLDDR